MSSDELKERSKELRRKGTDLLISAALHEAIAALTDAVAILATPVDAIGQKAVREVTEKCGIKRKSHQKGDR